MPASLWILLHNMYKLLATRQRCSLVPRLSLSLPLDFARANIVCEKLKERESLIQNRAHPRSSQLNSYAHSVRWAKSREGRRRAWKWANKDESWHNGKGSWERLWDKTYPKVGYIQPCTSSTLNMASTIWFIVSHCRSWAKTCGWAVHYSLSTATITISLSIENLVNLAICGQIMNHCQSVLCEVYKYTIMNKM